MANQQKQPDQNSKDSNSFLNPDVAEGDRHEVERALEIEDQKHLKEVIKPRPDHKTETNMH